MRLRAVRVVVAFMLMCSLQSAKAACILIGALGQGCGTVSVESKSWGLLRSTQCELSLRALPFGDVLRERMNPQCFSSEEAL